MMQSLNFPNFLADTGMIVTDKEATRSNLRLALLSEEGELFGDPYFGARLKQLMFSQQTPIIRDLIVDELYTKICTFVPQIYVTRKSITVESTRTKIIATINYWNKLDGTSDMYSIELLNTETA